MPVEFTDIQQTRKALDESLALIERIKQEWEVTVDALPQLVFLVDREQRIIRANRAIEQWGLSTVQNVRGKGVHDILHPECDLEECYLPSWFGSVDGPERPDAEVLEVFDSTLDRHLNLQHRRIVRPKERANHSYAVVVIEDISERMRAELALKERNLDLDAFGHTVAHELKGQLAPLLFLADKLRNQDRVSGADADQLLQLVWDQGYRMVNVIHELAVLAGLRKVAIVPEPLDMAAVIREAQRRLAPLIEQTNAEIITPTRWPIVYGHGPWMEEVWVNFLSNAIKYGGDPPTITLRHESNGPPCSRNQEIDTVRFFIADNGNGIDAKTRDELFEPFSRLTQARVKGFGLGLSIVRRIIDKMGGEVGLETRAGAGSTFTFTLPTAETGIIS